MILFSDRAENVGDAALDALRRDAVLDVIGLLLGAAAIGLVDRALHRPRDFIRIENDAAVDVARGAPDRLHERRFRTQKTFLVGIEDCDQSTFRNIQPFAQQIDADENVESAKAQIADDLDALQGVDVRMHVTHANAVLMQIFGEVFGHALGQDSDERAIADLGCVARLLQEIVDLRARGTNIDLRIDQARWANDLFDEDAARALQLPMAGRRGNANRLRTHRIPLFEA